MASDFILRDFFLSKNHTNGWFLCNTLLILLKEFYLFTKKFTFEFETCLNWTLSISPSKIYLQSCPNLLIDTNLRFLPPRNESIRSARAPSWMIWFTSQPPVLVEQNKWCRVKSTLIPIYRKWNGGCKNPQRIVSFKSHVAFYHIVLNEVLP